MESFTEQVQIGLVAWQRVCPAARARRRPGYYRLLAVPRIHLHANAEGTISGFEVSDSDFELAQIPGSPFGDPDKNSY